MPHLASSYTGIFRRADGFPSGGAVGDVLLLDAALNPEWGAGTPGPAGATDLITLDSVTDYTGGGATKLDGTTTVGVAVPQLYFFLHTDGTGRFYWLRAGTDAEASPGIVRPDDYSGANEKVFISVL